MPTTAAVPVLHATLEKTHQWLAELCAEGHFQDEQHAYSALRAVLHALRDRLPVTEAVHLAAQLPMLVRGFYYEGWKPTSISRDRSAQQFIHTVHMKLHENPNINAAHATRAVFAVLSHKIAGGEIRDIRLILPEDIRRLWPRAEP